MKKSDCETTPLNPLPTKSEKLDVTNQSNDQDNPSRGTQQWTNSREFLMSCIAMSVGLGNVWRFPYVAYENGGGAFLIPYIIMLFLVGRPFYFLELILGQFSGMSINKVWKEMTPIFRGIGAGQVIGCFYVVSYYSSLIALAIYYFFASFTKVLPWTICNPDIVVDIDGVEQVCHEGKHEVDPLTSTETSHNITLSTRNQGDIRIISPAEQYFLHHVLKAKPNIDDGIGSPDAKLVVCLALCHLCLFLSMCRGIKSSGKVSRSR
jgi:solute carrier family 6 amino acid transporter-like protein 5/7/9/14